MASSVMSMVMCILVVVTGLESGTLLELLLAGSWFRKELLISALERTERCSFVLNRNYGDCRWLGLLKVPSLGFDISPVDAMN